MKELNKERTGSSREQMSKSRTKQSKTGARHNIVEALRSQLFLFIVISTQDLHYL